MARVVAVERGKPGPKKVMSTEQTYFRGLLKKLSLDKQVALEAQRIGLLPEAELVAERNVLSRSTHFAGCLNISDLIAAARADGYSPRS